MYFKGCKCMVLRRFYVGNSNNNLTSLKFDTKRSLCAYITAFNFRYSTEQQCINFMVILKQVETKENIGIAIRRFCMARAILKANSTKRRLQFVDCMQICRIQALVTYHYFVQSTTKVQCVRSLNL